MKKRIKRSSLLWTTGLRCQHQVKQCSKRLGRSPHSPYPNAATERQHLRVLSCPSSILYITQFCLPHLRTAFGLLDRDSDGHVTPAELQFMLRNLGIEVSDDLIADLIKDASKTGNGLIDENEFMQWVTKIQALQGLDVTTSGGDSEEEVTRDLLAAFKVFDRDDNGYITRDELRSALEMIGEPVTDAQLNQVLALGDIDHDGRIDYEEFVKMLL
ncbi:calcium-binding protein E63-1 isoform X2 [Melitaea cinxia]|uniref:calcium-binding protein E63-1 isoform X2 n=1 Tax=Melitaea cinxia TaxID=113334 RepID=UPI001E272257|nr:calcium-binding protein E63-1 isoform X2 [Melitaea cinxia]XP_045448306.1 calcium-binding protein E63-1 isoform X2 [Melitaea cinxia]